MWNSWEIRSRTVLVLLVLLSVITSKIYAELTSYNLEVKITTTIPYMRAKNEAIQTESMIYYDSAEMTKDVTENWATEIQDEVEATDRQLNCTECTCGNHDSLMKIVGGSPSKENTYPWMAALYYNNRFRCGGSLVTDRYVLTAAHCVFRCSPDHFWVQLSVYKRTQPSPDSVERNVESIKTFFYSESTNNNDIALMKLTFPVKMSGDRLVPICLPQTNDNLYNGKMAIVTGWGKMSLGEMPDVLQELEVPILTNSKCRRMSNYQITNRMLCAGYVEGRRDSCQGDSGGPLQVFNNITLRYELVGIVSWGRACAQKNYPGVYTRVNKFLRWINNNVKDSCTCS